MELIEKIDKLPPLIKEWANIQLKYPDAYVLVEVGSFFELWEIDGLGHAKRASQILDIVLTRRDKSMGEKSPLMAGFPSASAQNYIKKLVDSGGTVVIVSQTIRGKKNDKNKKVDREITQIISPGTVVENLSSDRPNYFASIYFENNDVGIALIDVSTGEVIISEMPSSQLENFLEVKSPVEVLKIGDNEIKTKINENYILHSVNKPISKLSLAGSIIESVYFLPNPTSNPTTSLIILNIEMWRLGSLALANLLNYLTDYNSLLLKKVGNPTVYSINEHVQLPKNALISLEVFNTQTGKENQKDTLFGTIDRCKTSMGQRKLRQWLQSPLIDVNEINKRLNKVEELKQADNFLLELSGIYDFSRLARRMSISKLMPHESVNLYNSLIISENVLRTQGYFILAQKTKDICDYIIHTINIKRAENVSEITIDFFNNKTIDTELYNIYHKWKQEEIELDKLKSKFEELLNAKGKLRINEKLESFTLTGPKGLADKAKIQQIKINLKTSEIQIVDDDWINVSKSCLYYRHLFLAKADDVWKKFQYDFIEKFGNNIFEISDKISELDVLSNFALISKERNYVRPNFVEKESSFINFKKLRHPVIELSKKLTEGFVSNDVKLGENEKTLVIYGANSAGKSTILKSVAINIILAQIGCPIAASSGSELTVFESIQTRMASFDLLTEGLSTFTLEMYELQNALKYRKKKSIFCFDEIGRGSSVEDGEAIAYGTIAYLGEKNNKAITLFATHYHSLVEEITKLDSVRIAHVSCHTNPNGELVFSRKLEDGPGDGSYGIEVAKSCHLPEELIRIASRYSQKHFKIKESKYNKTLTATACELCKKNPFQQTHHIVEQKQGKIKEFNSNGEIKKIDDKSNLIMLCATCHELITRGEIIITGKVKTSKGYVLKFKDTSDTKIKQ